MSPNPTSLRPLLLVALAAFALGMMADRVFFFSGGAGAGPDTTPSDHRANRKSSHSQSAGPRGNNEQDRSPRDRGEHPDDERDPDHEEDGLPSPVRRVLEGLERGGRVDAAMAGGLLDQVNSVRHRREVIERLARHWGRQDPKAAAEWANELSGRDQWVALESLLHGWAETDPEGAAGYAARLPNSEHSLHMVQRMAQIWAEQDRPAAMNWGQTQLDPVKRQRALGGMVEVWAGTDPAAAAAFASSIDNPYDRHEVLEIAARRWAAQSTTEAMEWAQALSGVDRQRATSAVLHEVAESDPARAATLYENMTIRQPALSPQDENANRQTARDVASIWAHSDPGAAAIWALGLPEDGEVQRHAVADVAETWLRMDSMAAGMWILQLPEGATRDAAAERVVHSISREDPAAAFEWAASISDEDQQTGLMHHVLNDWRATDPSSALAAMNAANVSPDQRQHLGGLFGNAEVDPDAPEIPGPPENP